MNDDKHEKMYDVFLSYNKEDGKDVEKIAKYLANQVNLKTWFDQWQLVPGEPWIEALERGLVAAKSCAVFIGQSGQGPWQRQEIEAALMKQAENKDFRIILVLLPKAPEKPEIPLFLSRSMWVDLCEGLGKDVLWPLECGIKGMAPGQGRPDSISPSKIKIKTSENPVETPAISSFQTTSGKLKCPKPQTLNFNRMWVAASIVIFVVAFSFLMINFWPGQIGSTQKTTEPILNNPWIIPDFDMELVPIKAGEFRMGPENGEGGKKGNHKVILTQAFWMGKFEVTQLEYTKIMNGENPSNFKDVSNPVESINWHEAVKFCETITEKEKKNNRVPKGYVYRLPTEAEWEYACRAGTGTPFGIGDGMNISSHQANFNGNHPFGKGVKGPYIEKTSPVGSYKNGKNSLGLYDMHGNVWEWCLDAVNWNRGKGVQSDTYREGIQDPLCKVGKYRVVRGGSWNCNAIRCRSAYRRAESPEGRRVGVGFRVVLAPVQQQ